MRQVIRKAMVEAFQVPVRNRCQFVTRRGPSRLFIDDCGSGFARAGQRVPIHMMTRPRSQAMKQARCFRLVKTGLSERCGVALRDVMFAVIENSNADLHFGPGKARFLAGDL